MSSSRKVVPASVQFVDIGGLVEGASTGEGLGNKFLAHIREVDAVVYLLRAFVDADVPGMSDPLDCLRVVEIELALADLEAGRVADRAAAQGGQAGPLADRRGRRARRRARTAGGRHADLPGRARRRHSERCCGPTSCSPTSRSSRWSTSARTTSTGSTRSSLPSWPRWAIGPRCIGMCVQLEAEAAQFTGDERAEMLEALGLGEGGLERFIHAAYHLLGLRTFLTTGEKESRAWTFRAGSKAPQAAGAIHSDFERGFIKAEVIHWDELLEIGSWSKSREVGKLRDRGQGLRGRRRRRPRVPLQRLTARRRWPGCSATARCWPASSWRRRPRPRRGAARPGRHRGRDRCCAGPIRAHPRHAVPDRCGVLRPATSWCSAR